MPIPQSRKTLAGIALATTMLVACTRDSGAALAQKLEQQKSVKFSATHLACLNMELLEQAESYQKDGGTDGLDALRRTGKCEPLPADTEFPVIYLAKEDKNSVVIGVMKNPATLSVVVFTRYWTGS